MESVTPKNRDDDFTRIIGRRAALQQIIIAPSEILQNRLAYFAMTNDTPDTQPLQRDGRGRRRRPAVLGARRGDRGDGRLGRAVVVAAAPLPPRPRPRRTVTKKSLKKFESCLKKHGVKTPFPGAGGPPEGSQPSGTVPVGGRRPGGLQGEPQDPEGHEGVLAPPAGGIAFGRRRDRRRAPRRHSQRFATA